MMNSHAVTERFVIQPSCVAAVNVAACLNGYKITIQGMKITDEADMPAKPYFVKTISITDDQLVNESPTKAICRIVSGVLSSLSMNSGEIIKPPDPVEIKAK